ncbi:MAG: hypothetical protein DWG76_07390 [Chloroflexi bacterium]|nr:hypothetical protein [Chloroflexota bacterium]
MNSLEPQTEASRVERSLRHMLKNWAGRQAPPLDARRRLLRTARELQMRQTYGVMYFSNQHDTRSRQLELRSLFYAPQFSYAASWINF